MVGGCGPCRFGYYADIQRRIITRPRLRLHARSSSSRPARTSARSSRPSSSVAPDASYWQIWQAFKVSFRKAQAFDRIDRATIETRCFETERGATDKVRDRGAGAPRRGGVAARDRRGRGRGAAAVRRHAEARHRAAARSRSSASSTCCSSRSSTSTSRRYLGEQGRVAVARRLPHRLDRPVAQEPRRRATPTPRWPTAASPYLDYRVGGEGQATIGHTMMAKRAGYDGVIQLLPFTCMPDTIAKAILPAVSKNEDIPVLTLIVDEQTGKAGVHTRLEAFLDLLASRRRATRRGERARRDRQDEGLPRHRRRQRLHQPRAARRGPRGARRTSTRARRASRSRPCSAAWTSSSRSSTATGTSPACGATGSARYLTGVVVGADVVKNEITAHAVAALHSVPDVRTVLEIGGQDSKIILLRDGVVTDFAMNTVCAAGTGSFLDHQSQRLGIPIEEFGTYALRSEKGAQIAGRCGVFAESDMIHKQQMGYATEDIIMGLCESARPQLPQQPREGQGDRRARRVPGRRGGQRGHEARVRGGARDRGHHPAVPPRHGRPRQRDPGEGVRRAHRAGRRRSRASRRRSSSTRRRASTARAARTTARSPRSRSTARCSRASAAAAASGTSTRPSRTSRWSRSSSWSRTAYVPSTRFATVVIR